MSDQTLSDSTALAVDCAKYLQVLLVATDMGQHPAGLLPWQIQEATGLTPGRQAQVRTALRIAGLMHIKYDENPDSNGNYLYGYSLALGDGR